MKILCPYKKHGVVIFVMCIIMVYSNSRDGVEHCSDGGTVCDKQTSCCVDRAPVVPRASRRSSCRSALAAVGRMAMY